MFQKSHKGNLIDEIDPFDANHKFYHKHMIVCSLRYIKNKPKNGPLK